ncbi:hypothetical protein HW555_013386 [Spodoptera exigua]|uniref:Uncharacterized protein n=1 Tax=Spodoptera exigua TaxID=7107 RepID=A0A835G3K2_SPOEX|nr:hypothetical protein HW555_013386 [Spodoptera exigua]
MDCPTICATDQRQVTKNSGHPLVVDQEALRLVEFTMNGIDHAIRYGTNLVIVVRDLCLEAATTSRQHSSDRRPRPAFPSVAASENIAIRYAFILGKPCLSWTPVADKSIAYMCPLRALFRSTMKLRSLDTIPPLRLESATVVSRCDDIHPIKPLRPSRICRQYCGWMIRSCLIVFGSKETVKMKLKEATEIDTLFLHPDPKILLHCHACLDFRCVNLLVDLYK